MKTINRRTFLKTTGTGMAGLSLPQPCVPGQVRKAADHPNLVVVFPDQMRAHALGFVNEDPVVTPNLDRFSQQSLVITQAVSNYPLCSPFRASFLTGKYPHSNGVTGNCNSEGTQYGIELRKQEICWSDVLKRNRYSLGYIGKWHLDAPRRPYVRCSNNTEKLAWNEWTAPDRRHGFDFWYAYGTYDMHLNPMYWATKSRRDEPLWIHRWGPEHEADMAIRFIRNEDKLYRDENKPFALVVSMNPPHMPYDQVPQRYLDLYKDRPLAELCNRPNIPTEGTRLGDYYRENIRGYLAMVSGVDEQFGRILAALRDDHLDGNTIVLFMSDHGNCLGIHEFVAKNNHYEESVRTPFMLRWPGRIRPREDDVLISVPDYYPTLLDLMGFHNQTPHGVEGRSFAKLFTSGEGERPKSQLYLTVPYGQPGRGERGVRTSHYTLVIKSNADESPSVILHDNIADRYQLKNVAAENPNMVQQLKNEELVPWLRRTNDPFLDTLASLRLA